MLYTGTAHKVGDHIDTDAIIPARHLTLTDPAALGALCMSGLEEGWIQRVTPGDILVGGRNFGCGSSREHAPVSILGAGIRVVIAHSFARIFYRNSFNTGLLLLEIGDDIDKISDLDKLRVDAAAGTITDENTGEVIKVQPVPPFMQNLIGQGGLVHYVKDRLES
jgi:3-isopropylmalate/(R)-2-methylmalate dehydratase small subunit